MLDENLPTFFVKAGSDRQRNHRALYLSEQGNPAEPFYDLRSLDAADPRASNCYTSALFDAYNPESLFGEVLIRPGWTQPSLSQEEIRKNGGQAPPLQPVLPANFTINLYNPDQEIVVEQKPGSWGGSASYEFSMPQNVFRMPSTSALDMQARDPASDTTTPKINFVWRRDGKLSKDLICYMTGKSTDPVSKRRNKKDPDIAVALFRQLREVTMYEPNLYRVDMEDPKGMEVVILLSAIVLKDVYFGNLREAFNADVPSRKNSNGLTWKTSPTTQKPTPPPITQSPIVNTPPPMTSANNLPPGARRNPQQPNGVQQQQPQYPHRTQQPNGVPQQQQPPAGRTRADSAAQKKASEAEAKRLRKEEEAQEKERRKRAAQVEKETEKLRRKYGMQSQNAAAAQITSSQKPTSPNLRPPPSHAAQQRYSAPLLQAPFSGPSSPQPQPYQRPHSGGGGPRLHYHGGPMVAPQMHGGNASSRPSKMPPRPVQSQSSSRPTPVASVGLLSPQENKKLKAPKKSFWGLKVESDKQAKLKTKKSSLF